MGEKSFPDLPFKLNLNISGEAMKIVGYMFFYCLCAHFWQKTMEQCLLYCYGDHYIPRSKKEYFDFCNHSFCTVFQGGMYCNEKTFICMMLLTVHLPLFYVRYESYPYSAVIQFDCIFLTIWRICLKLLQSFKMMIVYN